MKHDSEVRRDLTCQHASNYSEIPRTSQCTRKTSTREAACRLGCWITLRAMLGVYRRETRARSLSYSGGHLILKNFAKRLIRGRATSHANEMTLLLRIVTLSRITGNKKRNCTVLHYRRDAINFRRVLESTACVRVGIT